MIKRQEIYIKLKNFKKRTVLLISTITIMAALIAFLVYLSGGTRYSYPHLIYLPILITAYFYKVKGGIISAILSGLFLGPLMPLNTDLMLMQSQPNWIFRISLLSIVGALAGSLFSLLDNQLEKVNEIAYYNQETGLANQVKMKEDLEAKIKEGKDFHLIIISVDNFLDIYKLIGFMNFSNYINKLVDHIKNFKHLKNSIYHINENKYGLIVEKNKIDDIAIFLKDFVGYLEQAVDFKQVSIFNDITLGISTYPEQSQIADELINQCFLALEKANNKKIHYWLYNKSKPNIKVPANNIELLAQVKDSITKNHFELFYQPKINLKNNEIEAFEALIRWHHPEKGFMPPAEFVSVVEKSSLIESLTNWVIRSAADDLNIFKENTLANNFNLAVNISARNLQQPDFTENLTEILNNKGIDPHNFSLEITETELMIDIKENIKKLKKLKDIGIKIYLDDFGKGYSSLRYLKELPVDFIKIDRYFIKSIDIEKSAENIIYSIINMAHALDLKVVAEGVETKNQLDFLKKINCDYAQGYYFARPDNKKNVINWVKENDSYILN